MTDSTWTLPTLSQMAAIVGSVTLLTGVGWAIAGPAIKGVIEETVDERITTLEDGQTTLQLNDSELRFKLDSLEQQRKDDREDLKAIRDDLRIIIDKLGD